METALLVAVALSLIAIASIAMLMAIIGLQRQLAHLRTRVIQLDLRLNEAEHTVRVLFENILPKPQ